MEEENNPAFIGHVPDIKTVQDDEFLKTEHSDYGLHIPLNSP